MEGAWNFAIVDEVDSILIDEARTPLIISQPDEESGALYQQFARIVPKLNAEQDYTLDEKHRSAVLTQDGITKVEELLGVKNLYEEGTSNVPGWYSFGASFRTSFACPSSF